MALFDFLKKKEEAEKAKKPEVKPAKKAEPASVKAKKEPRAEVKSTTSKKSGNFSYEIVKGPHISEKSTILSEQDKYTFKVDKHTNKPEIKKAIEGIYGVDVMKVNLINIPKKKRRLGKTEGFRKGYIKAVVTIKKGQKIEIF